MTRPHSRRGVLVAVATGSIAGCVEDPDDAAIPDDGGTADDGADPDETGDADATPTPVPPDRVDPEASGVVIEAAEITSVDHGDYVATLEVDVTLDNAGRFIYGLLEVRVDVYTTIPDRRKREAAGFEYVTWTFPSSDRFEEGTREVSATIAVRSRESGLRASADWYEIDAAVRRAEPSRE